MRQLLRLTTLGCVAVLAACGGPSGPGGPTAPDATAVTPTTAARGETITVTGTAFGTTPGTLTVGGVDATITAWSDTTIEATVPDAAPNGWQDVTVTTAGGSSSVPDLFVGVEFDGTGAELQEFLAEQVLGTAVLLQAETYDLTAETTALYIDNVDLYGRGEDATTILPPTVAPPLVFADFDATVTIADLTMIGASLGLLHGTVSDTVLAAAGSVPDIVFERFTFEMTGPGAFGLPIPSVPHLNVTVRDAVLDLESGELGIVVAGDVTLDNVEVSALALEVGAYMGGIDIVNSDLAGLSGLLAADAGLNIRGSTVDIGDGNLLLNGAVSALLSGSPLQIGGPIEVAESTIRVLDGDLGDATENGMLTMVTQFAPIKLLDNTLIRTHDDMSLQVVESFTGDGDIELTGNQDVSVGIFEAEDPVNARFASVVATVPSGNLRDRIEFAGNAIRASQAVVLNPISAGDVMLTGNNIAAGDGPTGNFTVSVPGEGTIVAEDNQITSKSILQFAAADLAGGTLHLTGNTLTKDSNAVGLLLVFGVDGSCDLSGNQITIDDPSETNLSVLSFTCHTNDPSRSFDFVDNAVVSTGAAGSSIQLNADSPGSVTVTSNSLTSAGTTGADLSGATAVISGNTLVSRFGQLLLLGDAASAVTFADNTVELGDPSGQAVMLSAIGSASVTDNTFTVTGTPGPAAVALAAEVTASPISLTATGNTFTGYSRALYFGDINGGALGIDAEVHDNVFDFVIDAAPKVAELESVGSVIDATNNVWGTNTDVATVESYVTYSGDTVAQSGDIALDPITQP